MAHKDDLITAKVFLSRTEAEIAMGYLEANGIRSLISCDDEGGMDLPLQLTNGVELKVFRKDSKNAEKLLAEKA